ncbi:hypothetical protein [Trichoplusia ni ascovirus 2c]|uniref:hypothetical protein n=1 Tax=Trichoplusia ni ascovirus 2c TaxID=328615 RepID=UPI0000E4420F|nr:hypothetical protein TNAV2c_gp055 [Trichoplusia ni ascovirus 2c]ABF70572.1 hypothetical protein [Trichoplusia ni ascovirus 2c]AUS94159.1 hypothetical protein [Trichoplusia ni ascovirus 6b]
MNSNKSTSSSSSSSSNTASSTMGRSKPPTFGPKGITSRQADVSLNKMIDRYQKNNSTGAYSKSKGPKYDGTCTNNYYAN